MIPGTAIKTGAFTIYLKIQNPDLLAEIPSEIIIGGLKIKLQHKSLAKCGTC